MQKLTQEMVDSQFSFSELGFQECETPRSLTALLRRNGFEVQPVETECCVVRERS